MLCQNGIELEMISSTEEPSTVVPGEMEHLKGGWSRTLRKLNKCRFNIGWAGGPASLTVVEGGVGRCRGSLRKLNKRRLNVTGTSVPGTMPAIEVDEVRVVLEEQGGTTRQGLLHRVIVDLSRCKDSHGTSGVDRPRPDLCEGTLSKDVDEAAFVSVDDIAVVIIESRPLLHGEDEGGVDYIEPPSTAFVRQGRTHELHGVDGVLHRDARGGAVVEHREVSDLPHVRECHPIRDGHLVIAIPASGTTTR